MRRADIGFSDLMIIILAVVILIIFALILVGAIQPFSSSASNFGEQASEVIGGG